MPLRECATISRVGSVLAHVQLLDGFGEVENSRFADDFGTRRARALLTVTSLGGFGFPIIRLGGRGWGLELPGRVSKAWRVIRAWNLPPLFGARRPKLAIWRRNGVKLSFLGFGPERAGISGGHWRWVTSFGFWLRRIDLIIPRWGQDHVAGLRDPTPPGRVQ